MERLLTVEDLAGLLCLSVATVKRKVFTHPEHLPPRCKVPGVVSVRFHPNDVKNWMDGLARFMSSTSNVHGEQEKKKRGRPTKEEQIQRKLASGGVQ